MSVSLIPSPNDQNTHDCPICYETDNQEYVNHTGSQHLSWHRSCGNEWLRRNNTCPVGCGALINDSHNSKLQKISTFSKKLMQGFSLGLEHSFNPHILATFTVTSIGALLCGKTGLARDILAIFGAGYLAAGAFIGIPRRLMNAEQAADTQVSKYAQSTAMICSAIAIVFALRGQTRDANLAQAIGALAILYKAGKMAIVKGAVLGTMFGLGSIKAKEMATLRKTAFTSAQAGGVAGGLAEIRKAPYLISLFSMATGSAIANATLQIAKGLNPYARAILAAAAGGIAASSTATVLDEGYSSYKQEGFTLF